MIITGTNQQKIIFNPFPLSTINKIFLTLKNNKKMRNKIVFRSAIITILANCPTIGENQQILKKEVVGSYVIRTIDDLINEAKLLYPNVDIKVELLGKYYTQSKYCKPLAELKFKKISIKDIDLNFA